MRQVLMRHETESFNGKPPGEPFVTNEDDVEYLTDKYGCEFIEYAGESEAEDEDAAEELAELLGIDDAEPELDPPVHVGGGWYEFNGDKYRRKELPSEAAALLE